MSPARGQRLLRALLAVLIIAATPPASAGAEQPVTLSAAFDRGARLGGAGILDVDLRINPRLAPSPATQLQLLVPAGVGITTSGLGVATCGLAASDFANVVLDGAIGLAGCPRNAVIGRGVARAQVSLGDPGETPTIVPEIGRVMILAGGISNGRLQLVALVRGDRPLGGLFAYAGEARPLGRPWGDSLWIQIPQIPLSTFSASVALLRLHVRIGDVIYYTRAGDPTSAYRPDAVQIPRRCPRAGFRIGANVHLADGTRHHARATLACPPRDRKKRAAGAERRVTPER